MSITTWGWGSGAITTSGWGAFVKEIILPALLAEYFSDRDVYTCVITRDYLEVKTREKGEIVLRLKPGSIPTRTWDDLLSREKGEISIRNAC